MMLCRNEHPDATPASTPGPVDNKPFGKRLNVLQTANHEIDESSPDAPDLVPRVERPLTEEPSSATISLPCPLTSSPICNRQRRSSGDSPEHSDHAGVAPDCTHPRTVIKVASCRDAAIRSRFDATGGKSAVIYSSNITATRYAIINAGKRSSQSSRFSPANMANIISKVLLNRSTKPSLSG